MPRHGKISLGTIEHKVQEYLAVVAQGADKVVTLTQADKNIFYLIIETQGVGYFQFGFVYFGVTCCCNFTG